ncbi:MAG: hypothetical protein JWM11_3187 [Planctomycetaceae bacterium]|nr:hypothetical protein [Planctomycetaceae bacterium]
MVAAIPQLWPPPADFSVMLQNPKVAFRDADLKTCQIARDSNNQPRACSGAFAVVYKGTYQAGATRTGDVAIRVFSSASSERQDRYKAISEYLNKYPLKCLVDFEYMEKGILHGKSGKWYPLIRMEWVQGDILFNHTRDLCQSGNRQALGSLSEKWVELVSDLARAKIAHGDLQHANVMVTDRGELKLVDYDCMCVPALEGRRNLELGVVPYQNPNRTDDTLLFSGLDNFSALFIFVVMRAFAAEPRLWESFVEPPDGQLYDKLLIRDTDFQSPTTSELFLELKRSSDQKVQKLVSKLIDFWNWDLQKIPSLAELVNDFDKVRSLLTAKAFDEALALLNTSKPISPPPKELVAEIDLAKQRVKCREELERAIQVGDELAIKQNYRAPLLDDYPKAAPAVEIARKADQAIAALNALQAAKAKQDWRNFVQTWEREAGLLTPRKSAAGIIVEARQWSKSNAACDEVWRAYRRRPPDYANLLTAWTQLKQLGGHPETQSEKARIEDLLHKYELLAEFTRLGGGAGEQIDSSRCRAWRENDFRGWEEAEPFRPEFEAAVARLKLYSELRQVLQRWPAAESVQGEATIVEQFNKLPVPYECDPEVKKRVLEAKRRLQAYQALQQAANQNPVLDTAVGKAWQELVKLQGRDLVPAKLQGRLDLAVQRIPVLTELTAISLTQPIDQLDAAVLRTWNVELLSIDEARPELRCKEADPWRTPFQHAAQRRDLLRNLEQSLMSGDITKVQELSGNALLVGYPVPEHLRIDNSSSLGDVLRLLAAIREGDRDRFREKFDASLIRKFPKEFKLVANELHQLIETEILPSSKNGIRRNVGSEPIVERSPGTMIFDIQWGWPQPRFLDRMIVGISRGTAPSHPDPEKLLTRLSTDRQTLKHGSGRFVLPAKREWLNSMVVVWGVIDLGFREYFTEPFTVGRLSSRGAK